MTFILGKHTDFDPVLTELKNHFEAEGEEKLKHAGLNTEKLKALH